MQPAAIASQDPGIGIPPLENNLSRASSVGCLCSSGDLVEVQVDDRVPLYIILHLLSYLYPFIFDSYQAYQHIS